MNGNFLALTIICILSFGGNIAEAKSKDNTDRSNLAMVNVAPIVKATSDQSITYAGSINFTGYVLLNETYKSLSKKSSPIKLMMTSKGGDPYAGIMIGRLINKTGMKLYIGSVCISACAKYIFPAAAIKVIGKKSIIGFHKTQSISIKNGSITTEEPKLAEYSNDISVKLPVFNYRWPGSDPLSIHIDRSHYFPQYFSACGKWTMNFDIQPTSLEMVKLSHERALSCQNFLKKQTSEFYNELGINAKLPEIGLKKLELAQNQPNSKIKFFYYDKASLEALGVKNITFHKEWKAANNKNYLNSVEVKLSDWR